MPNVKKESYKELESEEISLNEEQAKFVFDLLKNPPEPNEDLIALFKNNYLRQSDGFLIVSNFLIV